MATKVRRAGVIARPRGPKPDMGKVGKLTADGGKVIGTGFERGKHFYRVLLKGKEKHVLVKEAQFKGEKGEDEIEL